MRWPRHSVCHHPCETSPAQMPSKSQDRVWVVRKQRRAACRLRERKGRESHTAHDDEKAETVATESIATGTDTAATAENGPERGGRGTRKTRMTHDRDESIGGTGAEVAVEMVTGTRGTGGLKVLAVEAGLASIGDGAQAETRRGARTGTVIGLLTGEGASALRRTDGDAEIAIEAANTVYEV